MMLLRQQSFYFCSAVNLHQQTWGIPLNGCYQEILEFPGRLPQTIFCLIHFQSNTFSHVSRLSHLTHCPRFLIFLGSVSP